MRQEQDEIGRKIGSADKDHGLSQNELAERLNVSRQTISKWERGMVVPSGDNLISLSDLYGITLDELVHGKEEPVGEQAAGASSVESREKTDSAEAQTRPWYKLWWVKLLFGVLVLGALIFAVAGQMDKSDTIHLRDLKEKNLDLTSAEYFSWDDANN